MPTHARRPRTPRPTPVVYTLPNLTTAGSGRALYELARRLDRARFTPHLCLERRGGALETLFLEAGVAVHAGTVTVPGTPRPTLPLRALAAARRLDVPRGALWHSFHYLDDYSEPLIARLAGARGWIYTKKNMGWNARSWTLRTLGATRVLAQNSDMLRDFFGDRWRRRTRLVPRGVDAERFRPPENGDAPAPRRAELTVGCVAHLVPVKGHPTLLDAAARRPEVRVVIAGRPLDAGYAEGLERQVDRLGLGGRVDFLGGVDDVPALLHRLDVVVLPTWARWRMEGSPVALLEAMSSGRAVVATDIPGSRDLVEDGVSGLLVPPEDPDALAGALGRLVDPERRRRMGEAARRRVLERYTIEREVADHEAVYAEVLGL